MAGVVWRVSVMRSVCPALSPWLERLNERQRIDPGIPVVKPGVRNVRESHADAHPVAHGARDVQARAELDRTTEVDVASSAIGTDGEPGGEPPLLRDVEIAAASPSLLRSMSFSHRVPTERHRATHRENPDSASVARQGLVGVEAGAGV